MDAARPASFDDRSELLARLLLRNRLVTVLRVAVPAVGVLALALLLGQIWFANLARQYGIAGIRIDRGHLIVDTPQYSGTGTDGSRYLVSATQAQAALDHPELIALQHVTLEYARPGRAALFVATDAARMDTSTQVIEVPGVATISADDGMAGTLTEVRVDTVAQVTTAAGPVDVTLSDGTTIVSSNMLFDGATHTWTFGNATVTLPGLPEAEAP